MKTCDQQFLIIDYYFHELADSQRRDFEKHVQECALCQKQAEAFAATASLIKKIKRAQPEPALFRQYSQQLKAHYYPSKNLIARITEVLDSLIFKPTLAVRLAEAAVLILIGIFIGRMMFWKAQPIQQATNDKEFSAPVIASLVMDNFLLETEMILLDIVNTNPTDDEQVLLSLCQLAQYRNLLQKTKICRAEAEETHNAKLIKLTDDIELILLDLCNVEKKTLQEKIVEIKQEIDDMNLLFELKNFAAEKI